MAVCEACRQADAMMLIDDAWLCEGCTSGIADADGWEVCPTCDGEGAVMTDVPHYGDLVVCPRCHGEGEIATA